MSLETLAAVALAGYIVGDALAPVRRATAEALESMSERTEQAANQSQE